MSTLRAIVQSLQTAAEANEPVVLATVVRVTGSSYGGVGARMLLRPDGTSVGLVSGGCVESDIGEHARRVHAAGLPEILTYDTRSDDDAPWGLGLGCNGLIEVLLEPLLSEDAAALATMLNTALTANKPSVLATTLGDDSRAERSASGGARHLRTRAAAHALLTDPVQTIGGWGDGGLLQRVTHDGSAALAAGRRGLVRDYDEVQVAFEVIAPSIRLIICGSGPDAAPVAQLGALLGWDVTIVDHRPLAQERSARFPGVKVVHCEEPSQLPAYISSGRHTAAVIMSHHLARDTGYARALMHSNAAYIGVLGPGARTERMLGDLTAEGVELAGGRGNLFAPVGLDLGGEGPEAIALAIVSEVAAVLNQRTGGHLRDTRGPLHRK